MGDRTWAEIRIHKDFKQVVGTDDDKIANEHGLIEIEEDGDEVVFKDDQANYGHIESLESILKEHEIEFDLSWQAGGDYGAGTEYWRKVNGEYKCNDIYEGNEEVLSELKELLTVSDDLDKLVSKIRQKIKEIEPFEKTKLKGINSKRFIKED